MVWVSESPSAESSQHRVQLEGPEHLTDVAEWVDHVVSTETKRLESLGRKVLPLKVISCDLLPMHNTCNVDESCVFNRVNCATGFDFSKISSLEVGSIDQCLEETDGKTYFCTVCLLLVRRSVGENVSLLCPYVHCDADNQLKYWAFTNSKGESQYLVRSNIRQESAMQSYQEPSTEAKPQESPRQKRSSPTPREAETRTQQKNIERSIGKNSTAAVEAQANDIRTKWARLSLEQRADFLVVDDPEIVQRLLASLGCLFETSFKTSAQILRHLEGLPLLASLELGREAGGRQTLSISKSFLQDCNQFWMILEGLCSQLFSGTCRRRLACSEWLTLMPQASPNLLELQRRIAQLIEQRLWDLADSPCEEATPTMLCAPEAQSKSKKRRPRRKKKNGGEDALDSPSSWCSSGDTESQPAGILPVEESPEVPSDSSTCGPLDTNSLVETSLAGSQSNFIPPPGLKPPGLEVHVNSWVEPSRTDSHFPSIRTPRLEAHSNSLVEPSLDDSPPAFIQPPGLEIDDASLVQRLWERNQLLAKSLAQAGLKIPVLQLIQEPTPADNSIHFGAATTVSCH